MIYLQLFLEFFKIGIFSFGGGYATIPFLFNISTVHGWYTVKELSQIIAVASITPGPVGINAATYAGLKTSGLIGAFIATTSEVLPAFIMVILVSKLLKKYCDNFYLKSVIDTLKPISCALLASVAISLIISEIQNIKEIILLIILLLLSLKTKKTTLFYICISILFGVVSYIFLRQ